MNKSARPADSVPRSFVGRAPAWAVPYLRLARYDRPIGVWLLALPCLFGLFLAARQTEASLQTLAIAGALFVLGSFVMRGAGCTWNDMLDRDLDAKVARTAGRPLAAGQISLTAAALFLIAQALIGLIVLLQFDRFTVWLTIAALVPVAIYPLMKRITDWPQLVLGIAFNWGALSGWSALTHELSLAPLLLYLGCVFWTLGYDTIYAHQDKTDDAIIGVRSTALRLGPATKPFLAAVYASAILCWGGAITVAGLHAGTYLGLALCAFHLAGQIARARLDDPASCLKVFRSNREAGLLLLAALALGAFLPGGPFDFGAAGR